MKFAVVDVETTGGYAQSHRITEVGIVITNGAEVLAEYHTLINPGVNIPYHITALTGIDNYLTRSAPRFEEVAEKIKAMLDGCVFVAHHVDFDFSFIREEMERAGCSIKAHKLCTVRYARALLKDHKGFSLARLAKYFDIVNVQPHRALADAHTAAQILHRLLAMDEEDALKKKIVKMQADIKLPAFLQAEQYHNLPQAPGVYYFYDAYGKPLYIGKAKNLKKRITTHFLTQDTERGQAFMRQISKVETRLTGSDWMAYVLEDIEIRKFWPPFNSAQKRPNLAWQVVDYADGRGNTRLAVIKVKNGSNGWRSFATRTEARNWLHKLVVAHGLIPALCDVPEILFDHIMPTEAEHNNRMKRLKEEFTKAEVNHFLFEKGRRADEVSFVWMKNYRPWAIGFCPRLVQGNIKGMEKYMEVIHSSPTLEAIVEKHPNYKAMPKP